MTKELASLKSLCATSSGKKILKRLRKHKCRATEVESVKTTDSGKKSVGAEKALVGQIYKACENVRCLKPMIIHYIYSSVGALWKIFISIRFYRAWSVVNGELLLVS